VTPWLFKKIYIYEALKESLKGDLFVIYTDDAVWRKRAPDEYWYAFNSEQNCQSHKFDVIKIKDELSNDLIKKQSLLCKLLALKANDKGTDPEVLIRDIYQAVSKLKDQLTNDQLLLIEQFVSYYKKISNQTFEKIKEEANMSMIATTITEHYKNEGIIKGKIEGKIEGINEGIIKGKVEGEISLLEKLFQQAVLTKEQFEQMIAPLRKKYDEICMKNNALTVTCWF